MVRTGERDFTTVRSRILDRALDLSTIEQGLQTS
jgi:hypothetical protein